MAASEMNPHTRIKHSVSTTAVQWLFAMAVGLAVLWAPGAIGQPAPHPAEPPAPPIPIEQMRAFGYTKAFAERFALPPPEPGWEPGDGLLAVEFMVDPRQDADGRFVCAFKLYVDGQFAIAFPEPGPSGAVDLYTARTHAFVGSRKDGADLAAEDRRAQTQRLRPFGQLGAIATRDYEVGKSYTRTWASVTEFVRELFPGVNYVRVVAPCLFAFWPAPSDGGLNVWVKKSTGKDPSRDALLSPSEFHQFPLPPALMAKARPWAEWVNAWSRRTLEDARKQRELDYERSGRAPRGAAGRDARKVVEWKEQVQLSTGQVIVIERGDRYRPADDGRGGLGWLFDEAWLQADLPGVGPVRWDGSLRPLVLDVTPERRWFLLGVVGAYRGWKDYGLPEQKRYVAFELLGKTWQRVPFAQFSEGFKPNLFANAYQHFITEGKSGGVLMTFETKPQFDANPTLDGAYRKIDRALGQ